MTRHYDSFVLRCWQVHNEQRIEVEHLQSGGRARAETLGAALTWIDIHCRQSVEREVIVSRADDRTGQVLPGKERPSDNDATG